jgi:hypothetical protein
MNKIEYQDLSFPFLTDTISLDSFSCSDSDLEEFLKEDVLTSQNNRLSATRLVCYQSGLVGYFTLVNDCIAVSSLLKDHGEPGYPYRKYPAIKIARLATHSDFIRRGVGTGMILKIFQMVLSLSAHSGCRIITVDSKKDALSFYLDLGFTQAISKSQEIIPLYLDFHRFVEEERTHQ